ncbi:hypothetical protein ACOMHN_022879 [Nucella lapillus]
MVSVLCAPPVVPSYSDEHLEPVLKLADEYDVAHIRKKCSQFIHAQLECALSTDQAMRYLWLSDSFHLPELQPVLLGLSAEHRAEALGSAYFPRLQGDTQLRLMKRRCHLLQDKEEKHKRLLMVAGRAIRNMKPVVDKLPGIVESLPEKCPSLYCAPCQGGPPAVDLQMTPVPTERTRWSQARAVPQSDPSAHRTHTVEPGQGGPSV